MLHHVASGLLVPVQQARGIAEQPRLETFESGQHPLAVASVRTHKRLSACSGRRVPTWKQRLTAPSVTAAAEKKQILCFAGVGWFVAFRSAKGRAFAEQKPTIRPTTTLRWPNERRPRQLQ